MAYIAGLSDVSDVRRLCVPVPVMCALRPVLCGHTNFEPQNHEKKPNSIENLAANGTNDHQVRYHGQLGVVRVALERRN